MASSDRLYSSRTQVFWTCQALLQSKSISTKSEIQAVKGWRLAAIVHRLKDDYGWPILTDYRGPENVAHYRLKPGTDIARLRFPPSAKSLADGLEGGDA
ncbi:MAG TPA: hypothetical protein PK043_11390 [Alicycliphilus sp.]|mgnify:FL=1|nr:hypothetical protein [Alicycliphilus sp.]